MSTLPEKVIRVLAPFGSLASLLRNRDKVASGSAGKLAANDITVVTGRGICRQWTLVAGLPVDHGAVADEAAMLALHVDSAETPTPRWVVPGDSCTRTDDPGWRWHCISGNGTTLADWERRPLAGALSGLAVSGHTHTISAVTGLQTALDGKQAASDVLSDLTDVGGQLAYNGVVISGGGGGGSYDSDHIINLLKPRAWYKAHSGAKKADGTAATNGDVVATWEDQSGNGYNLIQDTNGPTFVANAYGSLPCFRFGTGSTLYRMWNAVLPLNLKDHTILLVAKGSATTQTYAYVLQFGFAPSWPLTTSMIWTADNTGGVAFRGNCGDTFMPALSSTQAGALILPAGVFGYRGYTIPNSATSNGSLTASEQTSTASSTYPTASTGFGLCCRLGASAPTTNKGFAGDIMELVIFPYGITWSAVGHAMAALRAKWLV